MQDSVIRQSCIQIQRLSGEEHSVGLHAAQGVPTVAESRPMTDAMLLGLASAAACIDSPRSFTSLRPSWEREKEQGGWLHARGWMRPRSSDRVAWLCLLMARATGEKDRNSG